MYFIKNKIIVCGKKITETVANLSVNEIINSPYCHSNKTKHKFIDEFKEKIDKTPIGELNKLTEKISYKDDKQVECHMKKYVLAYLTQYKQIGVTDNYNGKMIVCILILNHLNSFIEYVKEQYANDTNKTNNISVHQLSQFIDETVNLSDKLYGKNIIKTHPENKYDLFDHSTQNPNIRDFMQLRELIKHFIAWFFPVVIVTVIVTKVILSFLNVTLNKPDIENQYFLQE